MIEDQKIAFKEFNRKQHYFVFYSFAILVDLTVLNLFDQYWDNVHTSKTCKASFWTYCICYNFKR
ncbi:MAG: hypothetical protein Q9M32_04280 [Sulfurimonas sp.]|nr:hypothetical protein [Sulfurimonas sp.]